MPGLPLHLQDLSVAAPSGRQLVSVNALEVPAGGTLAIEGPSGAGKSTLLFALAGLIGRATGSVHWGETELLSASEPARARFRRDHMGMVFQDFLLFDELGAAANAAVAAGFAPKAERAGLAQRATAELSALGLEGDARSVVTYSGGERQRVSVARALAGNPKVLLADEPTAALHRDAADALADDLVARAKNTGLTLIVVSHDPGLSARMDRVLRLRDGQVAELTDA